MQLSQMADQKAQILLGVCSIIITFSLNQIASSNLTFGLITLIVLVFVAMVPAIMAVTPRLGHPEKDAKDKKEAPRLKNPLFFGSFAEVNSDQFLEEMNHVISDSDHLYEALYLNIYNNGEVMAEKKYRLISLSYNLFLAGMGIGTLTVLVEYFLF